MRRPRVVIVQRYVTHYRVPFFTHLRQDLADQGVDLELVHGFPDLTADSSKQDAVSVPWATKVTNRGLGFGSRSLLWQPVLGHVRDADLVIVEQASARLLNYLLFALQLTGRTRLAFWGHGKNFKDKTASPTGEQLKRLMSRRVHWWFAYNRVSAEVVRHLGYPVERITDVQNSIDTRELVEARRAITPNDDAALRARIGLPPTNVAVFVGGMYPEKRLQFLIAASESLRKLVPDFSLLLIGAGRDAHIASEAAARHPWIHYLGPRIGVAKVPYIAAADLLLMPGLVGLAILDSFALEVPIVSTQDAPHSPEVHYLDVGHNGLMLPSGTSSQRYAEEVARLLDDRSALNTLREGCRASASRYTVEEMSQRFTGGVLAALAAPPLR